MKQVLPIVIALFTFAAPLFADTRIITHVGDVQVNTGSEWEKPERKMKLIQGDVLRTGSDGYAELEQDGNRIQVSSNSQFRISASEDRGKRTGTLSMLWGRVVMVAKKLKKRDQPYTITTPSSTAAVRGTNFSVATGKDGTTLVQVNEGEVAVAGKSEEVRVRANQETTIPYGGDPSKIRIMDKFKWQDWLEESEKRADGNELAIMKTSLEKVRALDSEIRALEEYSEKKAKEAEKLLEEYKELKKKGKDFDEDELRRKIHRTRRASYTSKPKIRYKASRIELIRDFAKSVYERKADDAKVATMYIKIEKIYQSHYHYIEEIRENLRRRGLR